MAGPREMGFLLVFLSEVDFSRFTTSLNYIDMKPCKDFHVRISQKNFIKPLKVWAKIFFVKSEIWTFLYFEMTT